MLSAGVRVHCDVDPVVPTVTTQDVLSALAADDVVAA